MSIASVLIPSEKPHGTGATTGLGSPPGPHYSLLVSTDPALIEAAQRLRYDVFSSTPGFTLPATGEAFRDMDRFDEFCDHLLVRDDDTGELVGCYRMLPPSGAIAAGGLYTATEFDVREFDSLRPSLVEMGRAVVREGHRNGAVVLLMWAGILAYLDRYGYEYVTGCVSVPVETEGHPPGSQIRGVRDFIAKRHASQYRVRPYRPVRIDGRSLDDLSAPPRPSLPPLMRGYLRLGAQACGEPAHDPAFGVGDFCLLLDKKHADTRYLKRLRSVSASQPQRAETTDGAGR
ncbi:phosphohistidine phosphatase [Mycobacterium intermedium]|uniref:Phosphohistidine phosphatase n=1 Tax=Mycobacterium intermedium TaxID=28445 RepID=A0A1E3S750_MYCIE|nr:GNAT family N-acyltransferase [Mycobacterium intermedium]MCV6967969.1 GNAT family N-acetyltransferase [Mycobacterium intermedium]ODQ97901.1 phosphohistidine phosphatase [Mycobacterium intermedium]OPE48710.1 phosphohistidine phosphatase [Mycobacterium intermedium]ORA97799.1 phosphohistidine phosphatase [Mycobacterium intermedium]